MAGVSLLLSAAMWGGCAPTGSPLSPPEETDPLLPFLPPTPAAGGPVVTRAGRLTEQNFARESIPGDAAQGRIGDFYLANEVVRFVIQQPGRNISPLPYGGNVIDADFVERPAGDQLGEVGLLLLTGRTANFTQSEIVSDGSKGGPAVLRFRGADILDDYIDIRALPAVSSLFRESLQPSRELGLKLAVTYILAPGSAALEVIYTLYNPSTSEVQTSWGTLVDSGGALRGFAPGIGYGGTSQEALISGPVPVSEYLVQQGSGVSYGVIPAAQTAGTGAITLPISGVFISLFDLSRKEALWGEEALTVRIAPGQGTTRRLHLGVGRNGPDSIEQLVRKDLRGERLRTVLGTVTGSQSGERVIVGVRRSDWANHVSPTDIYTAVETIGTDGKTGFSTQLPPGRYVLRASVGARRGTAVTVDIPATAPPSGDEPIKVSLAVPEPARVDYRVLDEDGLPMPGRISVIGTPPEQDDALGTPEELPSYQGLYTMVRTLHGDSRTGGAWDPPLLLPPGTYRIVASHGPEWSRFESKYTVKAGDKLQLEAKLAHVVDTTGYLACDFHQHTVNSPDSDVTLERRVITNLAEGLEFVSSSDHDYLTDFKPVIAALGSRDRMDSAVGDEITPFGYGHFIAWPLRTVPESPNLGALDWGGGDGPNLTPRALFAELSKQGAQVLQVNHPRSAKVGPLSFQQNFDRAALRFDFAARTFYGDKNTVPVDALNLGLPEEAELFSDRFNSLEVLNGVASTRPDADGERLDLTTERILRDYMNFLSFGFLPAAVGSSDTHSLHEPAGLPRTLVRVPDDSSAALRRGVGDEVARTLTASGGAVRDIVVTNGPMLRLFAGQGGQRVGIGGTTRPEADKLRIELQVETPDWSPIHTVEVFANNTFPSTGAAALPLAPIVCFTSRVMPAERCRKAAVFGNLTVSRVTLASGGVVLRAQVQVEVETAKLLANNAAGATGKDVWLLARATGDQAMFPSAPTGIRADVSMSQLLDGVPVTDMGGFPLAFTNPLFVDIDGGGWRAPFQP